jgi:hypothetical protein
MIKHQLRNIMDGIREVSLLQSELYEKQRQLRDDIQKFVSSCEKDSQYIEKEMLISYQGQSFTLTIHKSGSYHTTIAKDIISLDL